MILAPDNEYCVVFDACVLMPMPLCDTLLRFGEEPSFYRMAWSPQILAEVARGLAGPRFGYTAVQVSRRLKAMEEAFPDAKVVFPDKLVEAVVGLPDENDRHVVGAGIRCGCNAIITNNLKDFPESVLAPFGMIVQTPDEFLCHQFHLSPDIARERIEIQRANLRKPQDLIGNLQRIVPKFTQLIAK